jgi:uncharacterized membrane protein
MSYAGFWLMLLIALIFAVLLGVAIYIALKAVSRQQPPAYGRTVGSAAQSPREVLDMRLARGEITPEEYSTARPLLDG